MTSATHDRAVAVPVLAWTGAIAAVWLIAGFIRSDTTLHLGPLLLPLVPAILSRGNEHPILITLFGIGAGIATIVVLLATGNLNGPALEPFPDALTESIVFLGVGGTIAVFLAASAGKRSR